MKSFRRRAVGLVVAVAALTALAAPSSAGASAATRWNLNATNALIVTGGQAPPVSMLHLAMVHGAMYDAVNAIDGGYTPYLVSPDATPFDSQDAAAATAAYYVLKSILPSQLGTLTTTVQHRPRDRPPGHAGQPGEGRRDRRRSGSRERDDRGENGRRTVRGVLLHVPAVPGPGDWRPLASGNDPNGWIRNVTPFLVNSAAQFRTKGPWPLTSPQYAREFDEVKSLGAKTNSTRTQHQTDAALYWARAPREDVVSHRARASRRSEGSRPPTVLASTPRST